MPGAQASAKEWVRSAPLHTVAWIAPPVGRALRPHAPKPVSRVPAITPAQPWAVGGAVPLPWSPEMSFHIGQP